jgi:DNA-binding transcriptional ArsR family regulator
MIQPIQPDQIDPVIHERVRLSIVSTLALVPEMTFNELKQILSLTDGNLSAHARKLEEAGYIHVEKSFKDRKPMTVLQLTHEGRLAYQKYLTMLKQIIAQDQSAKK